MGVDLMNNFYQIKIGKVSRKLKLIKGDGFAYYSFNMLGDSELNKESAIELCKKLSNDIDAIVTVESKAIALAQEVSSLLGHKRYVVIRKSKKSYMSNELSISGDTIISGKSDYFIDGDDVEYLKGKNVLVLDDVISTCGTIRSVKSLLDKCGIEIKQFACVFCEGKITDSFCNIPVISYGFFPLPEEK